MSSQPLRDGAPSAPGSDRSRAQGAPRKGAVVLTACLALAIFLLNVCLNAPLFMPGELPFRGSIENGYEAIARLARSAISCGVYGLKFCTMRTLSLSCPTLLQPSAAQE